MSEGPRLRMRPDGAGRVVLVFDRMPVLDSEGLEDWNAARTWLLALGYTPMRFVYEVELGD